MNALESLLKCGVIKKILAPNYNIYAQSQVIKNSNNPEYFLYEYIKRLPHWSINVNLLDF